MIESHLPQALERLLGQPPKQRGRAAEELVRLIFRRAHFSVWDSPGGARPRQSDLFASTERRHYLVEVKATRRKAGPAALAGLRDRLRRCPPDVIGVLISLSGFRQTVAREIAAERVRPVLLLGRAELFTMADGSEELRALLEQKLESLKLDGRVLLEPDEPGERLAGRALVEHPPYFLSPNGELLPWVAGGGSFGNYTFVRSLTDPTWGPGPETSAVLNLSLGLRSQDKLIGVLDGLGELGWLTHNGHWCIQQAATNWHGVSARNLKDALECWRERYAGVEELHYREEVCYADSSDLGFYTLTFDVAADAHREVWYTDFSLELAGVPLDQQPLYELCRTLRHGQPPYLQVRAEPSLKRTSLRALELRSLPAVAYLAVDDESADARRYVVGVVLENPLRGSRVDDLPGQLRIPLQESELLICDLRNWHLFDDRLVGYQLTSLEWGWTSGGLVVRVGADWDDEGFERRLQARFSERWQERRGPQA